MARKHSENHGATRSKQGFWGAGVLKRVIEWRDLATALPPPHTHFAPCRRHRHRAESLSAQPQRACLRRPVPRARRPRNRILRAIAFMKNKNRDPTIALEQGTTTTLQFQFYMPFSDKARRPASSQGACRAGSPLTVSL